MAKTPLQLVVLGREKHDGAALVSLLERTGEVMVLGRAAEAGLGTRMCRDRKPECVLLFVETSAQVELLKAVLAQAPLPVVALVRTPSLGVQVLGAGAVESLSVGADHQAVATALRLMAGVTIVGRRDAGLGPPRPPSSSMARAHKPQRGRPLVLVGTSTGGPAALGQLLATLGPAFGAPVVVVQHMPDDYHPRFAEWLATQTPLTVRLAESGTSVEPGVVYVAPGGSNLVVGHGGFLLARPRSAKGPCPSVDVLFESAALLQGFSVAGVVLTGMGVDGAKGLLAIRDAGGLTLVQDQASSVVYGMPSEALRVGAADLALSPPALAEQLRWWLAELTAPGAVAR